MRKDVEQKLADDLGSFFDDPYGFVMYAYPWGEAGTELENYEGPDDWQRDWLISWGEEIRRNGFQPGKSVPPIMKGTSSGHGIGKSALVAWVIQFIMSTRPRCRGTVTANTSVQLETRTWVELKKWHDLLINKHWFEYMGSSGNLKYRSVLFPVRWCTSGYTCKVENSESFAGQHDATSTSFYVFDEASNIPDKIWEVMLGGLTDGEPMAFVFGNPTRPSGMFYDVFHKYAHRWQLMKVDSRTAKMPNKALLDEWISDWGLGSDFVKVRILGEFPSKGTSQFFGMDVFDKCFATYFDDDSIMDMARTLAVDVSRFGGDFTVISERHGRKISILYEAQYQPVTETASVVASFAAKMAYDAIFVDDNGVGGGVTDILRQQGFDIIAFNAGEGARDKQHYFRRREEVYDLFRKAAAEGLDIEDNEKLREEIAAIEYSLTGKQQIRLIPKEITKKDYGFSPDHLDSIVMHWAEIIVPHQNSFNFNWQTPW